LLAGRFWVFLVARGFWVVAAAACVFVAGLLWALVAPGLRLLAGGCALGLGGAPGLGLLAGGCVLRFRGRSALGFGGAPGLRLLAGGCALGLGGG